MNPASIVGLIRNGMTLEAEAAMRAAGLTTGKSAVALLLQGLLAEARGDAETAFAKLAKASKLEPRDAALAADAGRLAHQLGYGADAVAYYGRAVRLRPGAVDLLYALGQCQIEHRQFVAAEATMRRVLDLAPGHDGAIGNIGGLLRLGNRFEEARQFFNGLGPQLAPGQVASSLADIALLEGEVAVAETLTRAALAATDNDLLAHSLGMVCFLQGRIAEAWPLLERRNLDHEPEVRALPFWRGEALTGPLLLHGEQGRGDIIQFARFVELAAARAPAVSFLVSRRFQRLFAALSPSARLVTSPQEIEGAPVRASVMSLPYLLGLNGEADLSPRSPYLTAEPELRRTWQDRLGAGGFKIGIAWQGAGAWHDNRRRAFPLPLLRPLARLPGVRLIALQTGEALKDIKALSPKFPVETYPLDEGADGFVDTAAVIANCDLVISTDTSIAHLAGALGAPTWLALSFNPDWRWMRGRADTPWYPTMRLFRQSKLDDWGQVFADMAAALPAFRSERGV